MKKLLLLLPVLFLLFNCSLFSQIGDVPLIWDENAPGDCVTSYHMYHSITSGGPYVEIGIIPVVDLNGDPIPGFTPTFTDVARDFSVNDAYYVVTALCVPTLESGFSNELKIAGPSAPGRLKIKRN